MVNHNMSFCTSCLYCEINDNLQVNSRCTHDKVVTHCLVTGYVDKPYCDFIRRGWHPALSQIDSLCQGYIPRQNNLGDMVNSIFQEKT